MDRASEFRAARVRGAGYGAFDRFQDWTPGPTYGKRRKPTFGDLRKAMAEQLAIVRQGNAGRRYMELRSLFIAGSVEAQQIEREIREAQNLPFTFRLSEFVAPLQARLEALIEKNMTAQPREETK